MPRWRLMQPHYINVPGTEWEYKEVDRTSGKQARKVYNVPLLLDPREPSDHNYPGEIIVAQGSSAHPKDIIFLGEPTPDMEPLDAEAEKITKKCEGKWVHPINSLPGQGDYGAGVMASFEKQLAALMSKMPAQPANPVSSGAIDPDAFAKLQEQVAALMAQNAELQAKAEASPQRRRA